MNGEGTFSYTYSAKENQEVLAIRKRMLASRRKKYAPEIIRLSESIMEN